MVRLAGRINIKNQIPAAEDRGRDFRYLRFLYVIALSLASLGWAYVVLLSLAWGGTPETFYQWFLLLFPFSYFGFCVLSCFKFMSDRNQIVAGVVFNLPVVMLAMYSLFVGSLAGAGICLAFVMVWVLLFRERLKLSS